MLVLEWLKKENRISYILKQDFYDEYEDDNVKYILLDDNILPIQDEDFLEFIHKQALLGRNILDSNGLKSSEYDSIISSWNNSALKIEKEMKEIKDWLNQHDYIINKKILGEYLEDSPKWLWYIEERNNKLSRYNELELVLNSL